MNNNDTLRRMRYIFNYGDDDVIKLFKMGGREVSRQEISAWLKKDEDPDQTPIYDQYLAAFLNGFIIQYRGKKDDEVPKAEKRLTNNIIFRKIKIALAMKDENIIDTMKLANFDVGRHEISAIFRKPTQSQYRLCKDQFLRNFLRAYKFSIEGSR